MGLGERWLLSSWSRGHFVILSLLKAERKIKHLSWDSQDTAILENQPMPMFFPPVKFESVFSVRVERVISWNAHFYRCMWYSVKQLCLCQKVKEYRLLFGVRCIWSFRVADAQLLPIHLGSVGNRARCKFWSWNPVFFLAWAHAIPLLRFWDQPDQKSEI